MSTMRRKKVPEVNNKTVGEKIKNARLMSGLTQSSFARSVGVSPQQINKYENGSNTISVEKIMLISQVLNLPTSFFLNDESAVDAHPFFSAVLEGEEGSSSDEAYTLVRLFLKIRSQKTRKLLLELAKTLAKNG